MLSVIKPIAAIPEALLAVFCVKIRFRPLWVYPQGPCTQIDILWLEVGIFHRSTQDSYRRVSVLYIKL